MAGKGAYTGADSIRIEGFDEFRKAIKRISPDLAKELKRSNKAIAELVVVAAKSAAGGNAQQALAASTLKASLSDVGARVQLGGGSRKGSSPQARVAAFAMGAEFGSYHDRIRLVKSSGGRHYALRSGQNVKQAIRRIEAQTVGAHGKGSVKKGQGEKVHVVGQVIGWNQFLPWRGAGEGAGYFLFPTIRRLRPEILRKYDEAVAHATAQAFPD